MVGITSQYQHLVFRGFITELSELHFVVPLLTVPFCLVITVHTISFDSTRKLSAPEWFI